MSPVYVAGGNLTNRDPPACSMWVPVVKIGEVTMAVRGGRMDVPVRVWLPGRCVWLVRVVVMNVVPMKVIMSQRLVIVLVCMPLAEVEPHTRATQQGPPPANGTARV